MAIRSRSTIVTTIYQPGKAWNGYTVLSALGTPAVVVLDMNGREVWRWEGYDLSAGGPARVVYPINWKWGRLLKSRYHP